MFVGEDIYIVGMLFHRFSFWGVRFALLLTLLSVISIVNTQDVQFFLTLADARMEEIPHSAALHSG